MVPGWGTLIGQAWGICWLQELRIGSDTEEVRRLRGGEGGQCSKRTTGGIDDSQGKRTDALSLSVKCCHTKYYKLNGLDNKNLLSQFWRRETWNWGVSRVGSLWRSNRRSCSNLSPLLIDGHHHVHLVFSLCIWLGPNFLFFYGHCIGLGNTQMTSFWLDYFCEDPIAILGVRTPTFLF